MDFDTYRAFAATLAEIDVERDPSPLFELAAADTRPQWRIDALAEFRRLPGQYVARASEVLLACLSSESVDLRRVAVSVGRQLAGKATPDGLVQLATAGLADPDKRVQEHAFDILDQAHTAASNDAL